MSSRKIYVHKGIQTDSIHYSTGPNLDKDLSVFSPNDALHDHSPPDLSQSSGLSSVLHVSDDLDAYNYSEASLLDDSRYISDRPANNPRRAQKYGQLSYNKPPHMASVNHRISSLPETSPPYRVAKLQESVVRLVSMPEPLEVLRHSIDRSNQYLDYSGNSYSKSSDADHTLFDRALRTPSPPSSPESIMIIGNETRVPRTFLRPKSNTDDDDQGGWITWKSSPPRPIPALHGPLSLPYARCPSGAEGTVIDGEDLTHMIWGLDSNGSQSLHAKNHGHKVSRHAPSSRPPNPVADLPHQNHIARSLRSQDVIDLSRPGLHAPFVDESRSCRPSRTSSNSVEGRPFRRDVRSANTNVCEFLRGDSPIQLYPTSFGPIQPEVKAWTAGLGIDLLQGAGTLLHPDSAFPLTGSRESQSILNRPVEPINTSQKYQAQHGLSVYDTRAYSNHRQRSEIPTPPDTGSPQWSPRFRQPYLALMSPNTRYEQIQAPRSDLPQHQPTGFARGPSIPSHKVQEQTPFSTVSDRCPTAELSGTGEVYQVPTSYRTLSTKIPIDSTSENHDILTESLLESGHIRGRPDTLRGHTPLSPISPDLRRNLSQQQPRSIPLARLIQRRLSSVAEEIETDEIPTVTTKSAKSSLAKPDQGLEQSTDGFAESEKGRGHFQKQKVEVAFNTVEGSSSDFTKRSYRLPGHLCRSVPASTRNVGPKPVAVTKPTILSANGSGENKENNATPQRASTKPKKSYKKRKYAKKQNPPAV